MQESENKNRVLLVLLPGWGVSASTAGNAIKLANPKNFNRIWNQYPHEILSISNDSDLSGCVSNYALLSAGRKLTSPLESIDQDISSGEFYNNEKLKEVFDNCNKNSSPLHLIGDIDNKDFNSSVSHIKALLKMAKDEDVMRVYLHLICDNDESNMDGVQNLFELIEKSDVGEIATLIGSDYVKSSKFKLTKVQKAVKAMAQGRGENALDPRQAIMYARRKNVSGQKLSPIVIVDGRQPVGKIQDFDSIIFFNFSPNSINKLADLFVNGFPKKMKPNSPYALKIATFTNYSLSQDKSYHAFEIKDFTPNLVEQVSRASRNQIHITDSEFSENITNKLSSEDVPYDNETWEIVSSDNYTNSKTTTKKVCDKTIDAIENENNDLIIVEFSGILKTINKFSIKEIAREITQIDLCLKDLEEITKMSELKMIVTSTLSGAENMNQRVSATSRVPAVFISSDKGKTEIRKKSSPDLLEMLKPNHSLLDITPTILELLGLDKPDVMTGESLAINFEG